MALVIQKNQNGIARDQWITPEEQLDRLNKYSYKLLANELSKSKINSIFNMAAAIAELANEPNPKLKLWYTALERLGTLPEKLPPLPKNIVEILEKRCPIYWWDEYKVMDTHSLYLIPAGSLNELERRVQHLGQQLYPNENPLRFWSFWDTVRQEHEHTQFNDPHWILMTNDVLPGSRNRSYATQVEMVKGLSQRGGANYEVPHLRDAAMFIFLNKIATDENLYEIGNAQNNQRWTYTRVQEATRDCQLVVGGFAPDGLDVNIRCYDYGDIGVAARRLFF